MECKLAELLFHLYDRDNVDKIEERKMSLTPHQKTLWSGGFLVTYIVHNPGER
jgi:hypothetical protein